MPDPKEASPRPLLGIVIPTLNEEERLPLLLQELRGLTLPNRVGVSDGGSLDRTRGVAEEWGALLVDAPPGRARQMNAGAEAVGTPWLLFLHADSRVPPASLRALEAWLPDADPRDFGTFRFALEGEGWFPRATEVGQRLREGVLGLAYGDQGLLVHRSLFERVGGFGDLPIMEDVEILRRLKGVGRWRRIPAPILTSPRRYHAGGRIRGWVRNQLLVILYYLGVPPARLASFYPNRKVPVRSVLVVFAKAPTPGRVKTRLAAEVGDAEAARIYSDMARGVVQGVTGGAYEVVVCFDPPEERKAIEEWLGTEGIHFLPQVRGDLGTRMEAAVRWALEKTGKVVVVGTDAPGVTRAIVEEALDRLDRVDLVLGPAEDGGYYLIGMRAPHAELFRCIPWSSSTVLRHTRERAGDLNLEVGILPTLRDVDTLEDWTRVRPTLKS